MHKLIAFSGLATAVAITSSGEDIHCIGDRAHVLRYDIEGEENDGTSMQGVSKAIITFDPARHHDEQCVNTESKAGLLNDETPSGDKELCYGVNQNSDCSGAEKTIPLENGAFECKDCYVSLKADAFFALNYTMTSLSSAQVGLRDIHMVGSASLHKSLSNSTTTLKGSYELANANRKITVIDKIVGCPVCVKAKVTIAAPTYLDYELDLSAKADITAGAQVDVHFSDRWAKYDSKNGWTYPEYKKDVSTTPILDITDNDVKANLNIGLRTSIQVDVDDIAWYHLDVHPTFALTAEMSGSVWPLKPKFCLKGDADMTIGHEADLDWNIFTWHAKNHWGPTQDKEWSQRDAISYCKGSEAEVEVLV